MPNSNIKNIKHAHNISKKRKQTSVLIFGTILVGLIIFVTIGIVAFDDGKLNNIASFGQMQELPKTT